MTLADVARVVGTVAALVGIVVTAPSAFGELWRDWRSLGSAFGSWVAKRLRAAFRRSAGDVSLSVHPASLGFSAALGTARVTTQASGFSSPGPDEPVETHLAKLWENVGRLSEEMHQVRVGHDQLSVQLRDDIASIRDQINSSKEQLAREIEGLRARLRATKQRSIRIYAKQACQRSWSASC